MARIRTIKPEIASDADLARISRDSRYTLVMLISQADDYGLLLGNPRQLLGALFPHDDDVSADVLAGWIGELEAAGIVRWRVRRDGAPVVQIVNWQRHQKVDHPHKPVLLEMLLPEDDPAAVAVLARVSRGSREDVPRPSRTDLTTVRPNDPTTERPPASPSPDGEAARGGWVATAAERWTREIGVVPHGRLGAALKPAVATFGEAAVLAAIADFATWRRVNADDFPPGKAPGLPYFVANIRGHIPRNLLAPAPEAA